MRRIGLRRIGPKVRLGVVLVAVAAVIVACGKSGTREKAAAPAASATPAPAVQPSAPAAAPVGSPDLGDYPTPAPVETVARVAEMPRPQRQTLEASATTKAVEIRIEGYQELSTLNGRPAPAGRSFLVLETTWRNVIPLKPSKARPQGSGRTYGAGGLGFAVGGEAAPPSGPQPTLEPTPYVVGEVPKHIWLVTENRYADPIDLQATAQVPGRLPTNRFVIARLGDVLKGKLVFDAPTGARYAALLFLDTAYGNALVPVKGVPADSPAPRTLAPAQQNELLDLAVTEAGWATGGPQPPEGFRYFVVGLRGMSRSATDIVQLELHKHAFVQTEQAFVAQPEMSPSWLDRPFTGLTAFLPAAPNEGQLAFLLPSDARQTMILLRPPGVGAIDLPAPDRVKATWPRTIATIADGRTLKIHCLPVGAPPSGLRPAPPGKTDMVLDLVVENLLSKGVELQPNQQFRLQDTSGTFYPPLPDSNRLAFRPTGRSVVPASGARRLQLLYRVPVAQLMRLAYRGLETAETIDLGQSGSGR